MCPPSEKMANLILEVIDGSLSNRLAKFCSVVVTSRTETLRMVFAKLHHPADRRRI